jgi:hypothetical protein
MPASLLPSATVTIPGRGDLSPRRRRGGGGARAGLVLLVAVVAAAVAYVVVAKPFSSSSGPTAHPVTCVPTRSASAPSVRDVRVRVRNASLRTGLAADVAKQLRHRGVHVTSVGNLGRVTTGAGAIRYTADRSVQARLLAAEAPGLTATQVAGHGRVELDLGPRWKGLATSSAARTQLAADGATATSTATPAPTASTCSPGPAAG